MMLRPSMACCSVLSYTRASGTPFRMVATSAMAAANEAHDGDAPRKAVNVRIKGTVQGVFYRQWTIDMARQVGVDGWVRNRSDGSVEALFSGKPDDVEAMIRFCQTGPPAARVSAVEANPSNAHVPKGFHRKPSE